MCSKMTAVSVEKHGKRFCMNYIVLDLEWNQCPYGKKREDPSLPFEIIEIGAVRMDEHYRKTGEFHEIIRPVLYRRLHRCTRTVIHMTEADFEGKRTFPEVFEDFLAWCGDRPVFCTWGPGDLTELQRNVAWNIRRKKLPDRWPFPFPLFFRDVQKIFSYVYEDHKSRRSLKWAVEYLNIPQDEPFHDAFSDAVYTALILGKLPVETVEEYTSIDTYITPGSRGEEIYADYGTYRKFISMGYSVRDDVMKDPTVIATRCPVCGRRLRRKIRWFSENGRNYLAVAVCPDHGYVKGKIRIRQNTKGLWYAIRTIRPITEEELEKVKEKKTALQQKRRMHRLTAG